VCGGGLGSLTSLVALPGGVETLRCDSDAVPPKTVQVIYRHRVQKSYRAFQVETSQQNAHGDFYWETSGFLKPHNSWPLNPYFVLFHAL
jgi:hypothetical protein